MPRRTVSLSVSSVRVLPSAETIPKTASRILNRHIPRSFLRCGGDAWLVFSCGATFPNAFYCNRPPSRHLIEPTQLIL
ncbi:hypothetical protein BT67DRAFT_438562 [Trichocladium antarcticum]|uniref:Uncharacterized protein n=1 Tax=Trichocladium antarcticum TaxID=1450529 RepID=A0AAN6UR30_9PEZI|nr:hypothetical protein BT67DRAFT_438562 [Trichocladium antarcticum]